MKKTKEASPIPTNSHFEPGGFTDSSPREKGKVTATLGTLEEVLENIQRAIEATEKLKQGLLQELLTKGVGRPSVRGVPEGWRRVSLGEIGAWQYGMAAYNPTGKAGTKLLRAADIAEDRTIDWIALPQYPINDMMYKRYGLKEGDIILVRMGSKVSKGCYVERPPRAVFASSLVRFQPRVPLYRRYLYFFFQSPRYLGQMEIKISTKSNPILFSHSLAKLTMPLPPLKEQKRIAEILDDVECKLSLLKTKKRSFEGIKGALRSNK